MLNLFAFHRILNSSEGGEKYMHLVTLSQILFMAKLSENSAEINGICLEHVEHWNPGYINMIQTMAKSLICADSARHGTYIK